MRDVEVKRQEGVWSILSKSAEIREGDTLVVTTAGLNEETWLDDSGHPHSDALKIVERFQRRDFGHLDVQLTIDDPKAYTKPWTVKIPWEYLPDTELLDWVCANNKDLEHIVGK